MPATIPPTMPPTSPTPLQLRDIHLPEPISWWPLAPGWWIALVILIILALLIVTIKKIRERKRTQKAALTELEKIRHFYQQDDDAVALIRSLSTLMRRASISFYPRHDASALTGDNWLSYLDNTARKKGFLHSDGKVLASAPYLPENHCPSINTEALLSLCEDWLRAQPVKGKPS